MSLGFVLGCTIIVEAYVLRRLRFDWLTVAIVLTGSIVCVDYLTYTPVSGRNYDGSSHIEYIPLMVAASAAVFVRAPGDARTDAPTALVRPAPGGDEP